MWKSSLGGLWWTSGRYTALTNVIFGQYNPGGRLPITYYPTSYVDQVPESDMQMRPSTTNPGRT
jgi:beta-D-xylosidase 4